MNCAASGGFDRTCFVDGFADDVHNTAECLLANGDGNRCAGIGDVLAANKAFRAVHGNRANGVFTEVLGDFENEALTLVLGFERVQNGWQDAAFELHVHDRAHDLPDLTDVIRCHFALVPSSLNTFHARREV